MTEKQRDQAHMRAHEILGAHKRSPLQCSKLINLIIELEGRDPQVTDEQVKQRALDRQIIWPEVTLTP